MNAEILPEILQKLPADRLVLGGLQELCPEVSELFVRDHRESRVAQSSLANARSLLEVTRLDVTAIDGVS